MQLSARDQLKGTLTSVTLGTIMAEVVVVGTGKTSPPPSLPAAG
jgi:molybdopterin-binding protein